MSIGQQVVGGTGILQCFELDADLLQQLIGGRAHGRLLKVDAAAEAQQHLAIHLKFIALGVATKIVMVIEDQDPGIGTFLLSVQERCGQAADTCPYHDQVVVLIQCLVLSGLLPAPGQRMGDFE